MIRRPVRCARVDYFQKKLLALYALKLAVIVEYLLVLVMIAGAMELLFDQAVLGALMGVIVLTWDYRENKGRSILAFRASTYRRSHTPNRPDQLP